jgi:hypothetical protein
MVGSGDFSDHGLPSFIVPNIINADSIDNQENNHHSCISFSNVIIKPNVLRISGSL